MESLIDKIMPLALAAVFAAAAAGQLPRFTYEVRMAQLRLLRDSRASTWGNPSIFASAHTHKPRVSAENHKKLAFMNY